LIGICAPLPGVCAPPPSVCTPPPGVYALPPGVCAPPLTYTHHSLPYAPLKQAYAPLYQRMRPTVCRMRPLSRRMRPSTSVCAPPTRVCAPQSAISAPYASVCAPSTCVCARDVITDIFWMKMSVRTSFSSGRPPASAFTRGRTHVRADAAQRPRRHRRPRGRITLPSLSLPPLGCPRGPKKNKFTIYNFRFSVFNHQNPRNPRNPRTPRAARAKPREEEGFFGLVPLVTHPSSIPLLGGLTPKFLSLSLHSL
jgi:hypothetical protein